MIKSCPFVWLQLHNNTRSLACYGKTHLLNATADYTSFCPSAVPKLFWRELRIGKPAEIQTSIRLAPNLEDVSLNALCEHILGALVDIWGTVFYCII
jgi:hypothetical protein